MIRILWAASVRTRYYLRSCAPTNILLDAIRTRRGLKWGVPAMLLAIPYLLIVSTCASWAVDGGPGWLNVVLLWAAWNSMKFVVIGPISLILLARARAIERAARRSQARRDTSVDSVVEVRA
ncbi:sulfate permease [Rathayibacter soli]|uniref:sulfate permease n=1 Tax=Rathayibacter soli TaxID=3144168 RepID=UPI0027E4BCB3|nr:sulfate permease [Glaciibacter superstes]